MSRLPLSSSTRIPVTADDRVSACFTNIERTLSAYQNDIERLVDARSRMDASEKRQRMENLALDRGGDSGGLENALKMLEADLTTSHEIEDDAKRCLSMRVGHDEPIVMDEKHLFTGLAPRPNGFERQAEPLMRSKRQGKTKGYVEEIRTESDMGRPTRTASTSSSKRQAQATQYPRHSQRISKCPSQSSRPSLPACASRITHYNQDSQSSPRRDFNSGSSTVTNNPGRLHSVYTSNPTSSYVTDLNPSYDLDPIPISDRNTFSSSAETYSVSNSESSETSTRAVLSTRPYRSRQRAQTPAQDILVYAEFKTGNEITIAEGTLTRKVYPRDRMETDMHDPLHSRRGGPRHRNRSCRADSEKHGHSSREYRRCDAKKGTVKSKKVLLQETLRKCSVFELWKKLCFTLHGRTHSSLIQSTQHKKK